VIRGTSWRVLAIEPRVDGFKNLILGEVS